MAGVEAPLMTAWQAPERGERGERRRGAGGPAESAAWREVGLQEGRRSWIIRAPAVLLCCLLATFSSCVKKKVAGRRREEREEKKRMEKKSKKI
jgi:hypothetical protein